MKNERRPKVIAYLLVSTLLFSTLAFGQEVSKTNANPASAVAETVSYAGYLMEVTGTADLSGSYSNEAKAIELILSSRTDKNAVLIDEYGYARELVLQQVATQLANSNARKKLYRVNWNALFAKTDQREFERTLDGVLKYIESAKDDVTVYLDDVASFSSETPILGAVVAQNLYRVLSQGKIQVLTAADNNI